MIRDGSDPAFTWKCGKVAKVEHDRFMLDGSAEARQWLPISVARGFADWARRVRNPTPRSTTLDIPGIGIGGTKVSEVRVSTNGAWFAKLSPRKCSVVVMFDMHQLRDATLRKHNALRGGHQLPKLSWASPAVGKCAWLVLKLPDVPLPVFRGQTIVFARGDIIRHLRNKIPNIAARDVADFMECIAVVRLTFHCEPDDVKGSTQQGCMLEHLQVSVCPAMKGSFLRHIARAGRNGGKFGELGCSRLGICWECMTAQLSQASTSGTKEPTFQAGDIVRRDNSEIGVVETASSTNVDSYAVRVFETGELAVCATSTMSHLHPQRPQFEVGDIVQLSGASSKK